MSYPDYDTPRLTGVLAEVAAERARQDAKWGPQNHPDGTGPDVVWTFTGPASFVAESARNACQAEAERGYANWRGIALEETAEAFAEDDPIKLRAEAIQNAAVWVAWAEAIDRRLTAGGE